MFLLLAKISNVAVYSLVGSTAAILGMLLFLLFAADDPSDDDHFV
jgi:hypothetical protein